ncbi:MAG: hypothetical protein EXR61_05855 [Chloroflexi bacterium]|nr:hypothetical protein [Chloroflexota bacterium]
MHTATVRRLPVACSGGAIQSVAHRGLRCRCDGADCVHRDRWATRFATRAPRPLGLDARRRTCGRDCAARRSAGDRVGRDRLHPVRRAARDRAAPGARPCPRHRAHHGCATPARVVGLGRAHCHRFGIQRAVARSSIVGVTGTVRAANGLVATGHPVRGRWLALLLVFAVLVGGCEAPTPPAPEPVARAYATAWQKGDVRGMWELLSEASRTEVGEAAFIDRLPRIAEEMTLRSLDATAGVATYPLGADGKPDPRRATIALSLVFHTARVGDVRRETSLAFTLVGEGPQATWRIAWTPEAILPRLTVGRLVRMTRVPTSRGRILARDGTELATFADAAVVGVVPRLMRSEATTLASLASVGIATDDVRSKMAQSWVKVDSFVPVRTVYDMNAELRQRLTVMEGVQVRVERARSYPSGLAAQTIGYLGVASDADAAKRSAAGVAPGELIGKAGLEATLDDVLGGAYGWRLSIVDAGEQPLDLLGEVAPVPGLDVVLALDPATQRAAEESLGTQKGAVVVEDPLTGEILALASRPSFDLNAFVRGDTAVIARLNTDAAKPLFNRATFGQYTTGSTFKMITAAAALRAGVYQPGERVNCPFRWTGYGESFVQINHESADLGLIDLRTALARSCNTFFYELGKRLNDKDPNLLPAGATSFGLGKATDIDFVFESEGIVPSPAWKLQRFANDPSLRGWNPGDATNLAIGQGFLVATPIQMANYASAIANDGTVWKPRLVIALQDRSGKTTKTYDVATAGKALTTPAELALIKDGMRGVVADPQGTVYFPFRTFTVPTAGKSGTAETSAGAPNAWFVGYAPYEKPTVVIAVVYEEKPGLLGSQDAGATARAVLGARLGAK